MHNWQGRLVAIAQENAAVLCEIKDTAQALAAALGKVKDEDRPLLKSEFYKMVNSALTEIDRDADAITWKIVERMESKRWIG